MTSTAAAVSSNFLPLEELQLRREQLEKEMELLYDSFTKLKDAQELFVQNISTLTSLKTVNPQQEALVPLTNSVFAVAQMAQTGKVLVDIGTGYFVEKEVKDADDYYVRKIKYLQGQLNMIGGVLDQKREMLQLVGQAIRLHSQRDATSRQ